MDYKDWLKSFYIKPEQLSKIYHEAAKVCFDRYGDNPNLDRKGVLSLLYMEVDDIFKTHRISLEEKNT